MGIFLTHTALLSLQAQNALSDFFGKVDKIEIKVFLFVVDLDLFLLSILPTYLKWI